MAQMRDKMSKPFEIVTKLIKTLYTGIDVGH